MFIFVKLKIIINQLNFYKMKKLELNQMENLNGGASYWDCILFIPAVLSPADAGILDFYFGAQCIKYIKNR